LFERVGLTVLALTLTLTLVSASVAHAAYDLVVTDIGGTENLADGAWVNFRATIQNIGDAPTPAGVVHGASFWVDGAVVSWSDTWTGPLAPGEAVVLEATAGPDPVWGGVWVATPGMHQVAAWVDDVNRLPDEADENNNVFTTTLNVASDAVLDVHTVSSSGLRAGEGVYFTALVDAHNGDPTVHVHGTGVTFYLDGNLLCTSSAVYLGTQANVQLDSRYRFIAADGSGQVPNDNGIWTATAGTHTIEAFTGGPAPSSMSLTFEVAASEPPPSGAPDLVVDAAFADTSPTAPGEILFHATIRNAGTAPTPAGVIAGVLFLVDGQAVSWSDTFSDAIAPGASVTVTANGGPFGKATWTGVSGTHALDAVVDDVNRIPGEADENNNILDTTLVVP
jgi:hypothetical protein